MSSTYLMLCLTRKGFGETILGLRVADDLIAAGDNVFVLAYQANSPLLEGSAYPHILIGAHAAPLFGLILEDLIHRHRPKAIILADYYNTVLYFVVNFLDPEILSRTKLPMVAIDIWDAQNTPLTTDVHVTDSHQVSFWEHELKHILPCPILRPNHKTGQCYNALPSQVHVHPKARERLRTLLGVSNGVPAVLFSTAVWQHANFENHGPAERLLARALPELIGSYIAGLNREIHLIHVGPEPYDLSSHLGDLYHWLPQRSLAGFDDVLAGCDLYLSANISATSVARSMVLSVPVLALKNSLTLAELGDVGLADFPISSEVLEWLRRVFPLRKFHMWPLGYYDFLDPLLKGNPYTSAVATAELLDMKTVTQVLSLLLFNSEARWEQKQRQASYIAQIQSLPRASQLIAAILAEIDGRALPELEQQRISGEVMPVVYDK